MSLFDRVLMESTFNRQQAATAAREALKKIRTLGRRPTRKSVVKVIVDALAAHPIVMAYLHDNFEKGKLGYHTLPDLLGDLMWDFKAYWELDQNDDFEELSLDSDLKRGLEAKLRSWKRPSKITVKLGPDYATAKHKADVIRNRVDSLSRSEYNKQRNISDIVAAISGLKKALQIK